MKQFTLIFLILCASQGIAQVITNRVTFSYDAGGNESQRTISAMQPIIYQQPQDLQVCSGSSATFRVVAGGNGPNYKWKKNGIEIDRTANALAGTNTLTVTANEVATYTCSVSTTGCRIIIFWILNT